MKSLSSTQAQKSFGDLVNQAMREPIAVTKHTREIFVIVPADEYHQMKKQCRQPSKNQPKPRPASSYIGSVQGVFASSEEVDRFIAQERAAWG